MQAGIDVAISMVSASAGVAVAAWKLSRDIGHIADMAQAALALAKQNKTDVDILSKEQANSWQEIARTLGRIEGTLGIQQDSRR